MTSRERVLTAFKHKEADRVPVDFCGTTCSSVHVIAYNRLLKHIGFKGRNIRIGCLTQQIVEADGDMQEKFQSDAKGIFFHPQRWTKWDSPYGVECLVPEKWKPVNQENGDITVNDGAGITRSKKLSNSHYFDPVNPLFADIKSLGELESRPDIFERWDWSPIYDESIEDYGKRSKELYENTDCAVVAEWQLHLIQAGQILRGYDQYFVDMLLDEKLAGRILDKLLGVYIERVRKFASVIRDSMDVVFLTDDLGTQTGPMINPELYRKLVKPYVKELIAFIKKETKKPVLMHSCGAISEFIPDFIEMGIDAVNPVQISAKGMEPAKLKKEFGKDIVFWGGGCDTQRVLHLGTPQEVKDEVKRNIDVFAPGGGFVFTQVHNIQPNVPPENIVAMYETALENGKY